MKFSKWQLPSHATQRFFPFKFLSSLQYSDGSGNNWTGSSQATIRTNNPERGPQGHRGTGRLTVPHSTVVLHETGRLAMPHSTVVLGETGRLTMPHSAVVLGETGAGSYCEEEVEDLWTMLLISRGQVGSSVIHCKPRNTVSMPTRRHGWADCNSVF